MAQKRRLDIDDSYDAEGAIAGGNAELPSPGFIDEFTKEDPGGNARASKQPRAGALSRGRSSLFRLGVSTLLPNGEDVRPKPFLDSKRNRNRPLLPPRHPTPPANTRLMRSSNFLGDAIESLGEATAPAPTVAKNEFGLNPKALALLTIAAEFALADFSGVLGSKGPQPPAAGMGHLAHASAAGDLSAQSGVSIAQPASSSVHHAGALHQAPQGLVPLHPTLQPQTFPSPQTQQQKQTQSSGTFDNPQLSLMNMLSVAGTLGAPAAYSSTSNFTANLPWVPQAQRSDLILDSEARHMFTPSGWRAPSAKPIHLLRKKKGVGAGEDSTRNMAIGSIMARTSMMYGTNQALLHAAASQVKPPSPLKPSFDSTIDSVPTFSSLLQQPENRSYFSDATNSTAN
jgi:hypothetical protein